MLKHTVKQLYPWLYQIKDPLDVNFYLIIGEDEALLFDTGFGIINIPAAVKEITSKPLAVILGHGHIDHACGAYQFPEVYLHEDDFELCRVHTAANMRDSIIKQLGEKTTEADFNPNSWRLAGTGKLKKLNCGEIFNLGNLHAEVIDMAGHTKGSIGLLIKEKELLLCGDAANAHCWVFLNESLPVKEYAAMLKRVMRLDFKEFCTAHQDEIHPKSDFDRFIRAAENATLEKAQPYGQHTEFKPFIYTEDGVSIVVNERTLNGTEITVANDLFGQIKP